MGIIKPTVGRKVWYRPSQFAYDPLDATIIAVWGDRVVNVLVTDAAGKQFPVMSVTLVQDGDPKPDSGCYVEWPTREPQTHEPQISACRGANCGATDGVSHSPECIVESAEEQGWADAPEAVEAKLTVIVKQFIADQKIRAPETIHQTDRVIENAYEFIEQLCDVVGYHKDEGDE